MKALSLVLRIVAAVGAIAAVVLFFLGQGKLAELDGDLQSARQELRAKQGELDEATATVEELTAEVEAAHTQVNDMQVAMQANQTELANALQLLGEKDAALEESRAQLAEKTQEAARYRADLVNAEARTAQAIPAGQAEELRLRIAELEELNSTLALDLASAKSRADRLEIERGDRLPEGVPQLQPGTLGPAVTLAAVDSNAGIVVISGGTEAGLLKGSEVTLVNQDLDAIARVKVAEVRGGLMVAGILPGTESGGLASGQQVKVLP